MTKKKFDLTKKKFESQNVNLIPAHLSEHNLGGEKESEKEA